MKRIEAIVCHLLRYQKKAVLPGIGLLHLYRSSAQLRAAEGLIHPPSEELLFTETGQLGAEQFMEQIKNLPLAPDTDLDLLNEEMNHFCRKADDAGFLQLGTIVQLQKKAEHWTMTSSSIEGISPYHQLPTLELPPLIHQEEKQEELTSTPGSKSSQKRVLPLLLTLLLLLFSALLWWWLPEVQEREEPFNKVLVNEERVNISPSELEYEDWEQAQQEKGTEPGDATVKEDAEEHSSRTEEEQDRKSEGKPSDVEQDLAINGKGAVDNEQERVEEYKNEAAEKQSTNEVRLSDQNCVVIVGAFGRKKNVESMEEKLSALGFSVFTQEYQGLTRVGLYSSCQSKKLDSVLAVCRNEIEASSWILDDK